MFGDVMFLHLGNNEVVSLKEIVAIMDLEKTTTTNTAREFLKYCADKNMVKTIGSDMPRSFIVTVKDGKQTVYLSPISTSTLTKRISKRVQKAGGRITDVLKEL